MKKTILIIAIALSSCLSVFSQATSMTVDCQNPGWLSSYISPSNIPSLRNLTVTGQINGTDLATIGNLVKNYNLQGRLDLTDVIISENCLTADMFGVADCKLQYLALPKSIGMMDKCIEWVEIDTLVCGSIERPDFRIGYSMAVGNYTDYCSNISLFNVKNLILREGVESFMILCQDVKNSSILYKNNTLTSIHFPNSIKHLLNFTYLESLSSMNVPEGVETLGPRTYTNIHFDSDTLFIPSSVKTLYDTWAGYEYKNAYIDPNKRNPDGNITCLYLPSNLETLWVDALINGTEVNIHIKAKTPPKTENGLFSSNTIVYVPVGYKDVYEATGRQLSSGRYSQWAGATIREEVYAEQISISAPSIMYTNETYNINADIIPTNTTFKDVRWTTSDNTILSVSNTGECTTKTCGEVQVTAMTADKSCTATKTIHVYAHTTGISLSTNSLTLKVGSISTLQASTLPLEMSDGQIEWSTSNDMIASVDDKGTIKAIGRGTCTITATSVDGGYTAECVVTVTQPVEALSLEKHSLPLKVGETESMYAQIAPLTADDKTLSWSSRDEEVATVDESGNVSALKAGETWIVAVSNDNAEAKDSCKVTVQQPVNGIILNHNTYTMNHIGDSFELEATVQPDDASNKNIKWKSSNESVCVVSNGMVVAVGDGTCVIIATTEDGGYMATCTVTVTIATGVSFVEIKDGQPFQIYDVNGMKRTSFKKGINIIRFVDGTMKKVQIK